MREASPRRHSIPFQVVCPSPPLLFSFFSALWRTDERHARHTTSLFFPLTHTTTHFTHTNTRSTSAEPNTPAPLLPITTPPPYFFSGSYFSLSHTQTETTIMRPACLSAPALPPPDRQNGPGTPFSFFYAPQADISPGTVIRGICALGGGRTPAGPCPCLPNLYPSP